MKMTLLMTIFMLFAIVASAVSFAREAEEKRSEADEYYLTQNYKKAFKNYLKLAKTGDHYAQDKIAYMYANGEGKAVDFSEAYAWSVLAEEGSRPLSPGSSDAMLEKVTDKSFAQKQALKLQKKYGQQALTEKALRRAEMDASRRSGNSMGSNLSR